MKHILGRDGRAALKRLAGSQVLLAFDYDGTLAPIVADPDEAALRPSTRALLGELTRRYPCIALSGRAQADALRRLRGLGLLEVVGNHGMEPWRPADNVLDEVQRWKSELEGRLGGLPGVWVEDKAFSLAVHYRLAKDRNQARQAILAAVQALQGIRTIGGKLVLNVLPQGAPDKGMALERERARLGLQAALYVGDDETDEDVFRRQDPERLLAIRVGPSRKSCAPYYLKRQSEVDVLLQLLLELRGPGGRDRSDLAA